MNGSNFSPLLAVVRITADNWTSFGVVCSYGSTTLRARGLGSKHFTELRPRCLFDDKSPCFPCQRHWVRLLGLGGHQPLLLERWAG